MTKEERRQYDALRYQSQSAQFVERNRARRKSASAWLSKYKEELECSVCGEKHPACLDFHHTGDKDYAVSNMISQGMAAATILAEIAKCVVLCANCHRKHHYQEARS